jgi:hypothetical protein
MGSRSLKFFPIAISIEHTYTWNSVLLGSQNIVLPIPDHDDGCAIAHSQFSKGMLDDQSFGAAEFASFIRASYHFKVVV